MNTSDIWKNEAEEAYNQALQITDDTSSDDFGITQKWLDLIKQEEDNDQIDNWYYSTGKYDLILINENPLDIDYNFWKKCTKENQKEFLSTLYEKSLHWWVLITTLEHISEKDTTPDKRKKYCIDIYEQLISVRFLKSNNEEVVPIEQEIVSFMPVLFDVYDHKRLLNLIEKLWTIAPDFFPRKYLSVYTFLSTLPGIDSTRHAFFEKELNRLIMEQTYRKQATQIPKDTHEIVIKLLQEWCVTSLTDSRQQAIETKTLETTEEWIQHYSPTKLDYYLWKHNVFEHDFSKDVLDGKKTILPASTRHFLFSLFQSLPWNESNRAIIQSEKNRIMSPESLSAWQGMVDERWWFESMVNSWMFDAQTMAKVSVIRMLQNFSDEADQLPEWNRQIAKKMFLSSFEKKVKNINIISDLTVLINSFHYAWDRSDIPEIQELIDMASELIVLQQEINSYKYTTIRWVTLPRILKDETEKKELGRLLAIQKNEVFPFFEWVGKLLRNRRNITFENAIAIQWRWTYNTNNRWSYFKEIREKKVWKNKELLTKKTIYPADYLKQFLALLPELVAIWDAELTHTTDEIWRVKSTSILKRIAYLFEHKFLWKWPKAEKMINSFP